MATLIDITGKIKNEEKFIKYGDKTYKVDDRKNTMLKIHAIMNERQTGDLNDIEKIMELLIGKDAVKDFNDLRYEDYLVPFYAAMACVQNKTYEEVENSFRNAK